MDCCAVGRLTVQLSGPMTRGVMVVVAFVFFDVSTSLIVAVIVTKPPLEPP